MSDVLKQTLVWASNPTHDAVVITGDSTFVSRSRSITAAESQDASDSTYERITSNVDGGSEFDVDGYGDVYGALQTASATGAISFIRVKSRVKTDAYTGAGHGSVAGGAQPLINGTARGSEDAGGASFANFQQDFTTDPADAAAWTNAKVNAQTFGQRVRAAASDGDSSWSIGCRTDLAEFSVELWGPSAQTSTPSSVAIVAAVGAIASVLGAVLSSCTSVDVPVSVGAAVGVPGLQTSALESVEVVGQVSDNAEALSQTGLRDPSAVTPLAATADGGSTPTTLRSNTSHLNDQNLATFNSDVDGFGVPGTASGTLTVSGGTGMQQAAIAGEGTISGVIFYAFARGRKDAHATLSNWRLAGASVSAPAIGATTPPYADFGIVSTALLTTDGGGLAWDWATIYAKLAAHDLTLKADYTFSGGHQFDESVQIDLAELWCEVHGPLGSTPDVIELTQVIASHRKTFAIATRL